MLIRRADLDAIAAGTVSVVFRRWKRPTVKAGGRLRTAVGELGIDAVDQISERAITTADAKAAGFDSRAALLAELRTREGDLYRIRLHYAGADRRKALRQDARLTKADVIALTERLDRYDDRSRRGPWTRAALGLIAERPGTRAPDLAADLGVETAWFKGNVRKLKEMGLTESLEVGYRLSPRGRALWKRMAP
jgi:hypothetical protein